MSVITQEYDIDLKATGWYPVVEMSQFDTGSRTIVLTVHDGKELVPLDGCVARIDGRRSDGVEFSASCSVGTGSRVSFTISQEMTRAAGKHVAELVIIDANGDTVGTQNFILDVEPASMLRDSAASADDRTLYDQYTSSIEAKFNSLSKDVNRTVEDISQAIGATSKPKTIIDQQCLVDNHWGFHVFLSYDPATSLCLLRVSGGMSGVSTTDTVSKTVMQLPADYLPDASLIDSVNGYVLASDQMQPMGTGRSDTSVAYVLDRDGNLIFKINLPSGDSQLSYYPDCEASWYARGGKFLGVETIGTGGNTIKVGTVTTGAAGTDATVVNSGTAKDVVLDFTIPKGDTGAAGGVYVLPAATSTTLGGIKVGSNLTIDDDGTLSATGGSSQDSVYGTPKGSIQISKEADASAKYEYGIAIGGKSSARGGGAIAIGVNAHVSGDNGIAIGSGTGAENYGSVALGFQSDSSPYSIAIGNGAKANGAHSVALGEGSVASDAYTVSFDYYAGNSKRGQRRLVGVATPTNDTDAANKAYVDSVCASLESLISDLRARVTELENK